MSGRDWAVVTRVSSRTVNPSGVTTTKRSRRKKELANLHVLIEKHRAMNERLKKLKLGFQEQRAINARDQCHPSALVPDTENPKNRETVFELPDLNLPNLVSVSEDVFEDEDEAPVASDNEHKDEAGGQTEVNENRNDDRSLDEDKEEIAPDETIHEAAVGKGLSGALKLLKERGTLRETIEWGGGNMDKKKRIGGYAHMLIPKEAFHSLSHKFHGKGPGKRKQEKRMKQYQEELKQMKNVDTPSLSAERMREAQAQKKTPYLALSGHVKHG
ncbi:hypothetical protein CRG98_031083 [Punica granatum]|uniref:SART-1 family protein DOT2 n=1 Tax=Punica granatum TaxID=22663 RepID=A0A2I0IWR3_PUNGR|nr:hypothetical protein CRG98_031083 [Punica granatum]